MIKTSPLSGIYRNHSVKLTEVSGWQIAEHFGDEERDKKNLLHDCVLVDWSHIGKISLSLCNAAKALKESGAKEIYSYIVHGVLSGNAIENIQNSHIKELILTDSIQVSEKVKNTKNIRHISIAPLMGEAIKRINSNSSVSALFD